MSNLQVANTIKDQIGRCAFMLMGAHTLLGGENFLQFTVGCRNDKAVKKVRVCLMPSDTYTVEFYGFRGQLKDTDEQVYAENLLDSIEKGTNLFLSFRSR